MIRRFGTIAVCLVPLMFTLRPECLAKPPLQGVIDLSLFNSDLRYLLFVPAGYELGYISVTTGGTPFMPPIVSPPQMFTVNLDNAGTDWKTALRIDFTDDGANAKAAVEPRLPTRMGP